MSVTAFAQLLASSSANCHRRYRRLLLPCRLRRLRRAVAPRRFRVLPSFSFQFRAGAADRRVATRVLRAHAGEGGTNQAAQTNQRKGTKP